MAVSARRRAKFNGTTAFLNKKENSTKGLARSYLCQIDRVPLNGGLATLPDPPPYHHTWNFVRLCMYICFVCGCEILSPTFEATSSNPTESEKAIVKAGSALRLGQLFTGDCPQSSAMTSESLSMHNTFQEYLHMEDRQNRISAGFWIL